MIDDKFWHFSFWRGMNKRLGFNIIVRNRNRNRKRGIGEMK